MSKNIAVMPKKDA